MKHKKRSIKLALLLILPCLLSSCKQEEPHIKQAVGTTEIEASRQKSDENKSTAITMTFGDTIVEAVLDDSEISQAFLAMLPMTLEMNRYAEREYYAPIQELPEKGEAIDDFENGDVTYYTAGKSLAIFFGNAQGSKQEDLIRMGKITSKLSLFETIPEHVEVTLAVKENDVSQSGYDFEAFTNVTITGVNPADLDDEQRSVLFQQARYCQAMTQADTRTMAELVAPDSSFTHMNGKQQTRDEYFADIEAGSLRYYKIGMEHPQIEVDGNHAYLTYTSVLDANAYGARGTYRMEGTHRFIKHNGKWISDNTKK